MMKKVETVIKVAVMIIQQVRNILKAEVSLNNLTRIETPVNSEGPEDANSLDCEDFTPPKDNPNELSLVDSENLASLIKRYRGCQH